MKIKLIRDKFTKQSTTGKLFVDGAFQCFTLEDTVRSAGVKVYGKTAIPAGTYDVSVTFSNKFGRLLPLLEDVPMFSGIRIHSGNAPKDTLGCILVGTARSADFVGGSRIAFTALFKKILEAKNKGEKITIEISST